MPLSAKLSKDGVAVFSDLVSDLTSDVVGNVMISLRHLRLIGDFWPRDGARELSFKKKIHRRPQIVIDQANLG